MKFSPLAPVTTGTYTWSPAAGLNSTAGNPVAASPATTTTYTVSNDNGAGCIRSASILITVNQRPAITAQPLPVIACAGTTANFTVTATGTGLTYQWQQSTDNCTTYHEYCNRYFSNIVFGECNCSNEWQSATAVS
ncbi:MAG: hypothetical protein WDM90_08880 [Ferruginibacter sp.]